MILSSPAPSSKRPSSTPPAKRGEKQSPRVNRARVQAMESRASATPHEAFSTVDDEIEEAIDAPVTRRTAASMSRRKPVARTYVISRALEYSYIRADMRRLIYTASGLFVLMIALLFVFD
jgi:hypothetical protein